MQPIWARYEEVDYPEIYDRIKEKREKLALNPMMIYQKSNWLPEFQWKIVTPEYKSTI